MGSGGVPWGSVGFPLRSAGFPLRFRWVPLGFHWVSVGFRWVLVEFASGSCWVCFWFQLLIAAGFDGAFQTVSSDPQKDYPTNTSKNSDIPNITKSISLNTSKAF